MTGQTFFIKMIDNLVDFADHDPELKDGLAYVDKQAPWNLKKTNIERMNTVLSVSIEIIRRATILLYPIMPESCNKILSLLNIDNNDINISKYEFIPSEPIIINDPFPIFPRIELND